MKFRKKPVVVEAEQWFEVIYDEKIWLPSVYYLNVGYYRHPEVDGQSTCKHCGKIMHSHGWIDTLEGGHIVCPGDWVITGVKGEMYPCKNDIFEMTYEPVNQKSD
jgi:hypothetical protein